MTAVARGREWEDGGVRGMGEWTGGAGRGDGEGLAPLFSAAGKHFLPLLLRDSSVSHSLKPFYSWASKILLGWHRGVFR